MTHPKRTYNQSRSALTTGAAYTDNLFDLQEYLHFTGNEPLSELCSSSILYDEWASDAQPPALGRHTPDAREHSVSVFPVQQLPNPRQGPTSRRVALPPQTRPDPRPPDPIQQSASSSSLLGPQHYCPFNDASVSYICAAIANRQKSLFKFFLVRSVFVG